MRARGAKVTDIVILDRGGRRRRHAPDHRGHQPRQGRGRARSSSRSTRSTSRAPTPTRVRQELTEYGVIPEEWGGQNMFVNVSAKKKHRHRRAARDGPAPGRRSRAQGEPRHVRLGQRPRGQARPRPRPGCHRPRQRAAPCASATRSWRAWPTAASAPCSTRRATPSPRPGPPTPWRSSASRRVPMAGDEFRVFHDERDARAARRRARAQAAPASRSRTASST